MTEEEMAEIKKAIEELSNKIDRLAAELAPQKSAQASLKKILSDFLLALFTDLAASGLIIVMLRYGPLALHAAGLLRDEEQISITIQGGTEGEKRDVENILRKHTFSALNEAEKILPDMRVDLMKKLEIIINDTCDILPYQKDTHA